MYSVINRDVTVLNHNTHSCSRVPPPEPWQDPVLFLPTDCLIKPPPLSLLQWSLQHIIAHNYSPYSIQYPINLTYLDDLLADIVLRLYANKVTDCFQSNVVFRDSTQCRSSVYWEAPTPKIWTKLQIFWIITTLVITFKSSVELITLKSY